MSEDKDDNRVETPHLVVAAGKLFGTWTAKQFRDLEKVMAESYQRGVDDERGGGAWTVIVLWDDGTVETMPINRAFDAHDAMRQAAGGDTDYRKDLQIIGAIKGDHVISPPCEDSGKAAWACDLKPEDDE